MAALHVGSERLLAGFDAVSGVLHARRPEGSADFNAVFVISRAWLPKRFAPRNISRCVLLA